MIDCFLKGDGKPFFMIKILENIKGKIMKKILLLSAVGISLAFSSATLISGTTQNVSFSSEPEGATVI